MLQVSGEKMSKSLGNLVTIEDFLKKYSADVLRLMVLHCGYRNSLLFTEETIQSAVTVLDRLDSALHPALPEAKGASSEVIENLNFQTTATKKGFLRAMDDDFNTVSGLGYLFDLARVIIQARSIGATDEQLQDAQHVMTELLDVLGLQIKKMVIQNHQVERWIDLLVQIHDELQKQKLTDLADDIKTQLEAKGVIIEASKDQKGWRWI
jgi:cysteinyl-tRNA synthetase